VGVVTRPAINPAAQVPLSKTTATRPLRMIIKGFDRIPVLL
jgi:hypothetical protein